MFEYLKIRMNNYCKRWFFVFIRFVSFSVPICIHFTSFYITPHVKAAVNRLVLRLLQPYPDNNETKLITLHIWWIQLQAACKANSTLSQAYSFKTKYSPRTDTSFSIIQQMNSLWHEKIYTHTHLMGCINSIGNKTLWRPTCSPWFETLSIPQELCNNFVSIQKKCVRV